MIMIPELRRNSDGWKYVSFRTNWPANPSLSWDLWPQRNRGGGIELPKETSFAYSTPQSQEDKGIQITVEEEGLTTAWREGRRCRSHPRFFRAMIMTGLAILIHFVGLRSNGQDLSPETQRLLNEIGTSAGWVKIGRAHV